MMEIIVFLFRLLFLLLIVKVNLAYSDTIWLNNDDRITGRIQSLDKDKLTLVTDFAGTININRNTIRYISNEKYLSIKLPNGESRHGRFIRHDNGDMIFTTKDNQRHDISLQQIKSFELTQAELERNRWKSNGHIDFVANTTTGNKDVASYKIDSAWQWRREDQRHTIETDAAVEEKDSVKSRDDYFIEYRYDHFFSETWFFTSNASFAQDRFKDLDRRITVGLGVGYQFWDDEQGKLSVESSANHVSEEYGESAITDSNKFAWRWGMDYQRNIINKKTQFFHQHDGLILAQGDSKNIFKSKTGIRFIVNSSLSAVVQIDWEYDSLPVSGHRKEDVAYSVGLGYKW